ncbi:MAG: homocysteine S-methyltransferase [Woeseiaceae bacterium]
MHDKTRFNALLDAGLPIVIDGGLATQLEAQGCDLSNPLWSASMIQSDPLQIVAAHRVYLDAGARIIISASYQTTEPNLVAGAAHLALRARDEFVADNADAEFPLVAASIGPYGAVRSDGSEYTGDYDKDRAGLVSFHEARIAQLDVSAVDILACETIPSIDEASALSELLLGVATPAWVSFSCRDDARINDGTRIEIAAQLFQDHPNVKAIGVNCTAPQYVESLIGKIRASLPDMPIVVYPNSGEKFDAGSKTWSGMTTTDDWVAAAAAWRVAGASIIGGCCRTTPEHVAAISKS